MPAFATPAKQNFQSASKYVSRAGRRPKVTKRSKPTIFEGISKVLYFGTTEKVAKEAPVKGIEPPVVLSDVYPGFFAFWASMDSNQRWGIVEVDVENLMPDSIAPFHGYIEKLGRRKQLTTEQILERRDKYLASVVTQKEKWKKSLDCCGVVLYLLKVPPHAVTKVTTFDAFRKGANKFVVEGSIRCNPWEVSPPEHKDAYAYNLALTQWLACEEVSTRGLNNASQVEEHLQNRLGLELYYRRTEKDLHHWWKI
jgi:hypothetical protein